MFFDRILRPALYRLSGGDAEVVHERTVRALARIATFPPALTALRSRYGVDAPVNVFGLRFPNRVGLAAGMDKDGRALAAWPALGFGFVEVGTVTKLAQPGNPRPRLFALPRSEAVINRMGFNNAGAEALARRLAASGKPEVPLGISIGKSKVTPLEDAVADYCSSLTTLYPYADYFAINVSSPNTPGLRSLQDRQALADLLQQLHETSVALARPSARPPTPLLVKVSPDLTDDALGELLEVCLEQHVAGVIATNTTVGRHSIAAKEEHLARQQGGLSGRPLAARASEVVRFVHKRAGDRLPVIGVGGILDPTDAERMIDAGASLVQLYTGFALHGPELVLRVNRALSAQRGVAC